MDGRRGDVGLFPRLLGSEFMGLPPMLQRVHGGTSVRLRGTANVVRGRHPVAKLFAIAARLPPAMERVPIEVSIDPAPDGECWTRSYGARHTMRSTLHGEPDGFSEQIGLARMSFGLETDGRTIVWRLQRVRALGLPLPRDWFVVSATALARGARYGFVVSASLRGIGLVVRYDGELDVVE